MSHYWIFGSTKPLGLELTKSLKAEHDITCFSRSRGITDNSVELDFSDISATKQILDLHFSLNIPDGCVFCQRYRPCDEFTEIDNIKNGLDVELGPLLSFLELASLSKSKKPISIVLISSVAGVYAHSDVTFSYHVLKGVTISATRTLSALYAKYNVRVNCIILGEFQKYPRQQYNAIKQREQSAIENHAFESRLCSIPDIVSVITFLLSNQASYVTGQCIFLDGGLSNLSTESMVRQLTQSGES